MLPSEYARRNIMSDITLFGEELVEEILADYNKGRAADCIDSIFEIPDKDETVKVLTELRNIIFPGYFKNKICRVYTMKNNVTMLLEDVMYRLSKQISSVLRYLPEYNCADETCRFNKAQEIAAEFVRKIPRLREYINTDVEAAYAGDPAAYNHDEIIFSYPGLFAIMTNRIAHELHLLGVPLIPRIMTEYAHSRTGIDIHPGASIGKYFFIDHGTGIVIGETTEIGENVKIYQGVTLGALSTRGGQSLRNKKRHPTIKDNVTIYSGASILGGDTVIGKNVVIGGNVFITSSVPDGARVSLKNQELTFRFTSDTEFIRTEYSQPDNWYYII